MWRAVGPVLETAADDQTHFEEVTCLGVDEHLWHHVSTKPLDQGGQEPKKFTGMIDLTRDEHGRVHARLLNLVPGRSGDAYKKQLTEHGDAFCKGVKVATPDPFHGYKNTIDDAVVVLDAFHVVKLATTALAEVRRIPEHILTSLPTCPLPEIARLGRTLNRSRDAFLGYFTTNGGTERSSSAAVYTFDPTLKTEEPVIHR